MPVIIGPLEIEKVGDATVVNLGDSFYISPKSDGKSTVGSGASSTGDFLLINNLLNATNFIDPDFSDQNIVGNK